MPGDYNNIVYQLNKYGVFEPFGFIIIYVQMKTCGVNAEEIDYVFVIAKFGCVIESVKGKTNVPWGLRYG